MDKVKTGRLVSVNVMHELIPDTSGHLDRTAIDKRPASEPVEVGPLGLAGDQQYDVRHHGGPEKALYAHALEDLAWWAAELDRPLRPGQFGENLTTEGLDVTNALIGERWRIGADVEVEVTMPRTPCVTFQAWLGEPRWVKRFYARGAPGAYLRVVTVGSIKAGDSIEVVRRPERGITIADVLRNDADLADR